MSPDFTDAVLAPAQAGPREHHASQRPTNCAMFGQRLIEGLRRRFVFGHVPTSAGHECRSGSICCQDHDGVAGTIDAVSLYGQAYSGHSSRGYESRAREDRVVGTIPATVAPLAGNDPMNRTVTPRWLIPAGIV